MGEGSEDWTSYRRLVLSDLHEIKKEIHELRKITSQHHLTHQNDMLKLKVKVASISGIISTGMSLITAWLSGVFKH